MPAYRWTRRPSKHFGEVWVPVVQIQIRRLGGAFQGFALQVDSGAVVSLLSRSVADLLGIELQTGRRVELGGVGGASTVAYVHALEARMDEQSPTMQIPFAIAQIEAVPNLLGWLEVFDRWHVEFDPTRAHTRFWSPRSL